MKRLAVTIYHNDIVVLDVDEYYITENVNPLIKINKEDVSEYIECFEDYNLIYLNLTEAFPCTSNGYLEDRWFPKK